jgi:hypothetical protein
MKESLQGMLVEIDAAEAAALKARKAIEDPNQ